MNSADIGVFLRTLERLCQSFPAPTNSQYYRKTKVDIWLKDLKDFIEAYQSFDTSAKRDE